MKRKTRQTKIKLFLCLELPDITNSTKQTLGNSDFFFKWMLLPTNLFTEAMPMNTHHPWKNRSQPHVATIHCVILSIYQLVWRPNVILYLLQNIHAVWMSGDVWKHNQLFQHQSRASGKHNCTAPWMHAIVGMKVSSRCQSNQSQLRRMSGRACVLKLFHVHDCAANCTPSIILRSTCTPALHLTSLIQMYLLCTRINYFFCEQIHPEVTLLGWQDVKIQELISNFTHTHTHMHAHMRIHTHTHTHWALGKWSPKRSQGTADAASLQGQVTQRKTTGRDKATQPAFSTQSASHRKCHWLKCPPSHGQGHKTTKQKTHKSTHWTQSWQFCWKTCRRTLCRWVLRSKDLPRLRTAAADRWLVTGQGSHLHHNHHQAAEPTTSVFSALFTGEQTAKEWQRKIHWVSPQTILNELSHGGLQDQKQRWVLYWHIRSFLMH